MERASTNDISVLLDADARRTAERIIALCGIPAGLKGFDYLADAIILYGLKGCRTLVNVYSRVAKLRGTDSKSVMHAIEYAVCVNPDAAEHACALLGTELPRKYLRNGVIIPALGRLLAHKTAEAHA